MGPQHVYYLLRRSSKPRSSHQRADAVVYYWVDVHFFFDSGIYNPTRPGAVTDQLTDRHPVDLEPGRHDLLLAPLGIVVGVVLVERLLLGRRKPEALLDAGVALQVRSGRQSARHPLDRHHVALARQERVRVDDLHEGGLEAGPVQQGKHLGVGLVRDLRLALEVVRPDAIVGRDAVLVQQDRVARQRGHVVDLLGLALDQQLAQLDSSN